MPVASLSGTQAAGGALWAQMQQQQAQRSADQAEQRASILQSQARVAQGDAARAQERARTLQVESNSAQNDAGQARRNVASMKSLEGVQAQLTDLQGQISKILQPVATTDVLAPVVNALGQETGRVVNTTA